MVFNEKQKLNLLGFKIVYILISLGSLSTIPLGDNGLEFTSSENLFWIVALGIFLLALYLFVFETPAYTRVDQSGIHYKYRPFAWNFKLIPWKEIKSLEFSQISPLGDYGGWGYRYAGKKGWGIIMSNKMALHITHSSGKIFTITTGRRQELEKVIAYWQNDKMKHG